MRIREYQETDRRDLKEITIICFKGVSIDENVEERFGQIAGKNWAWRKERQMDDDIAVNPNGIFVAEEDGKPIGYITTRVDQVTKVGRIPNLGVLPAYRNSGIGRKLMARASAHLRSESMKCVRIETLEQNAVGQRFYPSCGFKEVARQIHYIRRLDIT